MYVDDETKIDMATSISGSGPAYIFLLMEAMVDAGVHMGFPRDQATKLVYQTMLGSTLYAMKTNGKFRTVIKDAMWACYRRSMEMGGTHDASTNVGPGQRGGSSYHTPP
jgi:pyrroline-5-carboxylate reductase